MDSGTATWIPQHRGVVSVEHRAHARVYRRV